MRNLLSGAFLIFACVVTSTGYAAENKHHSGQIIIKFKQSVLDPSDKKFVDGLSRDAGAPLEYVRRFYDYSHIYKFTQMPDSSCIENALKKLGDREDVVTVEEDGAVFPTK